MASTIPPVLVELQLETASIKAQMEALGKKFDDFGATVSKQTSFLSNFKAAAVGVFAGNVMTQGLNLLKSGIQGAIQEAQDYEKATAQLRAGIESTGNVAGLSVQGLQQSASALESLSGQDEIAIMKNQALLQTFTNVRNVVGKGNDIFDQATLAMLNMGAKMGDNAGSALQLGKALNDPVRGIGALQRVGVVFTAQQKEQVKAMVESGDVMGAQKIILKELNTEFGGAAKAAGDTFAGSVARAKDKVTDFARDLVTNLQPILLNIGKTIGDLYNKFLAPLFSWIGKNKEAVALFVGILTTAWAITKAYSIMMGVVTAATELYTVATVLMAGGKLADVAATEAQTGAMTLLNAVMTASPITWIVLGLAALAAAFVVAWNHSETFRKVVIKAFQGVLSGVSFAIRALSEFVEFANKWLILPFKTLLTALSHLPGVGKYAKAALSFMDNIPNVLDKAADKVDSFSASLSKLEDKKITIPGFGGSKTADTGATGGTGTAPGGGLTAAQIAEAKKNAKEKAKALTKLNDDVRSSYDKMNNVIKDARDKSVKLETEFNQKVVSINKDYNDKKLAIEKDYADKATALTEKADQDRLSVIQKGRDLLRNAFETGAKFDLAKMFDDSDKSGAGLLQKMKDKFAAVKKLQEQAGALASAGFSQTFIQEVISQGPEIGGSMANAVLNSAPETQAQLKELYAGLQDVSKHGLDDLANQMSTSTSFATEELLNEYMKIGSDLDDALAKNSRELADALKKNQSELNDALLAAQTAYNDAIDALEKDTKDKLATLQDELKKTADQIKELAGAKAAAGALAGSPSAPILANTASLGLAGKSSGDVIINQTNTVNGTNLVDPNATVDAMANASRFGSGQSLYSGKIAMLQRMGIM